MLGAFAASGVLLTLAQSPVSIWVLAWVAYVPFVLVCSPKTKSLRLAFAAWIVGSFFWLGNIYWMSYVTVGGWIAFCLYTALLWPILAISIRFCRAKKIPLVIAVPVLVVAAENLQGLFLGGFYWHYLAHSQYANTTLIQIADIFGAAGVSFLVGMVNGLLAELIIAAHQKNIFRSANFLKAALVCVALAGVILYGRWRTGQSDEFVETGPLVGAVQSNVPQSVKQSFSAEEQIFADLLEQSRQCVAAGADLVVWPETMVQAVLNTEIWPYLSSSQMSEVFHNRLNEHAKDTASLLVGAYDIQLKPREDAEADFGRYNSAFLYRPDGTQAATRYSKIHLVPFGEYIPFKQTVPFLHKLLLTFTPYDYDYTLDPGSDYTIFEMSTRGSENDRVYRFSAMICYEGVVPAMARRFALDERGNKRIDWLVNISNDGWFVRFSDGKVKPSTELAQHTAICAFRAVENRVAVLRSVNTGISCLIDTFGRIRDGFLAGNLPRNAMDRRGMAGWFVDQIPIDKRTTFFSRFGRWLDYLCEICLGLLVMIQLRGSFSRKDGRNQRAKN